MPPGAPVDHEKRDISNAGCVTTPLSCSVSDGDTQRASVVGDVIVLYHDDVQVVRAQDATFKDGNPGMGLWRGGPCGVRGDYGFTSDSAQSR